jgi:two-component system sensor histidine kinase TctE
VQQLLDFARLEPGVQSEPFAATDLARLAREVVGRYAAQAEAQDVDLGAEAPAAAPMMGSEPQLRALIENLVDNALRYAPRETPVTVSVRARDGELELVVVDAGRGIPECERERVFERFHRVAGDPTRGSGLGLAISKAIVERHLGSITLSDAGPGLAVTVRLPVGATAKTLSHQEFKSALSFGSAS